jgi:glycosyltransferase involved in cell wall biosynthesis
MARAIRDRKIDVLHAHQYSPFFYSALARVIDCGGPRLVLTEHGRHYPDLVRPLRRAVNRLVLDRLADAVNACCVFSAKGLAQVDGFAGGRIEVIENGIDLTRYSRPVSRSAAKEKLGLDRARRYIGTIARFHPVKDHATLLRAFVEIAAARPEVDLLLAGDGPLRAELERFAVDSGIAGRVHFLGIRSDVPVLLQACDLFALTSLSEAASLTLLEAMASSLAVVVTDVGGNPEIVREGIEGLLVPRRDAPATAKAFLQILDDPALGARMGAAGRVRVEAHYTLQRTIDRYFALYQRVSGRLPQRRPIPYTPVLLNHSQNGVVQ